MADALEMCHRAVVNRQKLLIGVVNAAKIVRMRRETLLRESVLAADVVFADGMAVVWASRLCGQPLPERIAGIDLFQRLLELSEGQGHSVYLLGARQDVLDTLCARLSESFPNLKIAGTRNGYFDDDQAGAITDSINASGADMLFLGMSTPKKEIFLASQADRLAPYVCHGVGGSFDVLAGKTRRAPRLWQRLGMEWFYRVLQEPRRMWRRYLVTNTAFIFLTIREMFRRGSART
jgi:N-acetylglucosaminyldiphosphoundecaprenol N-acetyl-beta-D-mannosaminyltransferase